MHSGKEQNWARALWPKPFKPPWLPHWLWGFSSRNAQHVTGAPLLWRSSPYWDSLCHVLSDGMYLRATPHHPRHATHSSAFLVPVAVLSVGGVCVRKRERERRKSVEAMVHRPDGFKQTPSKAKDEMNHLGAILLEGVWLGLGLDTWHQRLAGKNKKNKKQRMKREKEEGNYIIWWMVLLKFGATMWQNWCLKRQWFASVMCIETRPCSLPFSSTVRLKLAVIQRKSARKSGTH